MNIQQCRYVLEVAEKGSFREAARSLFMAQSSLSQSIKDLEEEYEITIFIRSNKGVKITSEGSEFLEYARKMVAFADQVNNRYLNSSNKRKTFSVSNLHLQYVNQAFIKLVKEGNYKDLNFRLIERTLQRTVVDVQNSHSELGFIYLNSYNRRVLKQAFLERELDFFPLFEFKNYIVTRKDHPLTKKEVILPEDLLDYRLIVIEKNTDKEFDVPEKNQWLDNNQTLVYVDSVDLQIYLLKTCDFVSTGNYLYLSSLPEGLIRLPVAVEDDTELGYIRSKRMRVTEMELEFLDNLGQLIKNQLDDSDPFVKFIGASYDLTQV